MVPGGELRNDTAVARVQLGLRVHHVGQHASARALAGTTVHLDHGGGRLVATRLQTEDAHGLCLDRGSPGRQRKGVTPGASYFDRLATIARTSPANSPFGSRSR